MNKDFEYAQQLVAELAANEVGNVSITEVDGQVYLTFDGLSLHVNIVGIVSIFTDINKALKAVGTQSLSHINYATESYVVYLSSDYNHRYEMDVFRLNAVWFENTKVVDGSYIERLDIALGVNLDDIQAKVTAWKETYPWIEERQEKRCYVESSDDCGYFGYGH
jgi:hypothetical protein